jgi:hypothetical protein
VSVLLGNGDGTFQPAVNYPVGSGARSVTVGDFNGDGKLDLAVANLSDNNVTTLLGNGDGTFAAAGNYAVGTGAVSVAAGDFNGDGKLDLAVANFYSANVSVLLGNGNGTFQPLAFRTLPPGLHPSSIALGDFNADGRLDLAVGKSLGTNVSVLLGNGDGTFQDAVDYPTGNVPYWVTVGDFNGDGKLDLAVANEGSNNVSVLLGNGNGSFATAVNYLAGGAPIALGAADFNGDGKVDLAVANEGTDNVSVLLNTTKPATSTSLASSLNPSGLGQAVTFTATVSSAQGTPTGSVTFKDAASTLGSGTLSGGTATFTTSSLAAGSHSIRAFYSGDSDFASSTSAALMQSVLAPAVGLVPNSLDFGDQTLGTTSALQTVILTNTGNDDLTLTKIGTTGDFAETDNCGSSVAAGVSCTLSVRFTPTATGLRSGSITIEDNATDSPQSITLSGIGTGLETTTSITVPAVTYGSSASVTVAVTSGQGTVTGNVSLTVDNASPLTQALSGGSTLFTLNGLTGGDHALSASYPAQGGFLASSATGTLHVNQARPTVSFTGAPTSPAPYNSTFTVTATTNASSTAVITASGACSITGNAVTMTSGTGTCSLTASWAADTNYLAATATQSTAATKATSTTTITFNTPNPSAPGQAVAFGFTVAGNGLSSGTVTVAASTSEACTGILSASAGSCSLTFVTVGSRTLIATYSGDANFTTSTSPGVTQTVSGPLASVSPTSLNFGNVYLGLPAIRAVTLTNIGNAPMSVGKVQVSGGNDNDDFIPLSLCRSTLAAGKSCQIIVTFLADSDDYSPTATLSVTDNALGSPQSVPLSGTVINPKAKLSSSSLNFGKQTVGTTSAAKTVTLTNTGTTALTLSTLTVGGDFALASGTTCVNGSTLAAAASCAINVTFTPKAKGARLGSVTIKDNALLNKQVVVLSGTGI